MNINYNEIYKKLLKMVGEKKISDFVDAGSFACALISKTNVYYGINFQAGCGLSLCAERSAIASAITNYENEFTHIICIFKDGKLAFPCGCCRELFAQLSKNNLNCEVVTSINPLKSVKLKTLLPNWWGKTTNR